MTSKTRTKTKKKATVNDTSKTSAAVDITSQQAPEIEHQEPPTTIIRYVNSPYKAPPCEICHRKTEVKSTQGAVRYIKCVYCGWTFKDIGKTRNEILASLK